MLARVAALAALGGFLFGYDLGLIGGAMLGISEAFNITSTLTKEAIVGSAKLGAFFGTFIGGVLMLRYGRRAAISAQSFFFVIGPFIMALATGPGGLVVGRLLVGVGIGASAIVVPAYLAEIAPAAKRGAVVQTYEAGLWIVQLGWIIESGSSNGSSSGDSLLATSASHDNATADSHQRAVALAEDELLLLWSSVQKEQAAGLTRRQQARPPPASSNSSTPEAVRTGYMPGNQPNAAISSDGGATGLTAQQQQRAWQQCEPGHEANVFVSLYAMLCDIVIVARGPERPAFLIAAALAVLDQATASTAVINYAPEVLSHQLGVAEAGSAILYPAVISVTKCIGAGIALLVVDAWGRRPLLIYGGIGCGAALVFAAVALAAGSVAGFLFCLCLFIFCFSTSWAGLYWVVVSEIFSMGSKSPATSAATSLLFLTGAVVNFVFLSLVGGLGPGAFGIFAAVAFGSAWYVYRAVPETKGRTLAEIQALLAAPAPLPAADGRLKQQILPSVSYVDVVFFYSSSVWRWDHEPVAAGLLRLFHCTFAAMAKQLKPSTTVDYPLRNDVDASASPDRAAGLALAPVSFFDALPDNFIAFIAVKTSSDDACRLLAVSKFGCPTAAGSSTAHDIKSCRTGWFLVGREAEQDAGAAAGQAMAVITDCLGAEVTPVIRALLSHPECPASAGGYWGMMFLGLLLSTTALAASGGGMLLVQHLLGLSGVQSGTEAVPVPAPDISPGEPTTSEPRVKERWLYSPPASCVKYHVREFLAAVLLLLKTQQMRSAKLEGLAMLELLQYNITKELWRHDCQEQDAAASFVQGYGVLQEWDVDPDILRRAGLPPGATLTGEQLRFLRFAQASFNNPNNNARLIM
eukprot:gene6601-6829_t